MVLFILNIHNNVQVIPPGMEFHHIVPHNGDVDGEVERDEGSPASPDPPIWSEVIIVLSSFNPKNKEVLSFSSFWL